MEKKSKKRHVSDLTWDELDEIGSIAAIKAIVQRDLVKRMNEIIDAHRRLQAQPDTSSNFIFVRFSGPHPRMQFGGTPSNLVAQRKLEVVRWCADNCKNQFTLTFPTMSIDLGVICFNGEYGGLFANDRDAMLFKMRFG